MIVIYRVLRHTQGFTQFDIDKKNDEFKFAIYSVKKSTCGKVLFSRNFRDKKSDSNLFRILNFILQNSLKNR